MSLQFCTLLATILVLVTNVNGKISTNLENDCKENPEKRCNIILELSPINKSKFSPDSSDLVDFLKFESWESQRPVIAAVQNINEQIAEEINSFWIANRVALRNTSCVHINELSNIAGVKLVRNEVVASFQIEGEATLTDWDIDAKITPQWGVSKIEADHVWQWTQGEGIVVANIDTGVLSTHEALRDNFRSGEFSWLDGITNSSTSTPSDGHGHGTHTMGSICGRKGVGVAPNAQWIACKGCNSQGCQETALLNCGQWVACPYSTNNGVRSDCSQRPNVVSCSWGTDDAEGRHFYHEVVQNWRDFNIIPFFALGNSGPSCSTTKSPADHNSVISVGATDSTDNVADFSSRGPSVMTSEIKPDISAPGHQVVSCWKKNDTSYAKLSGTSMACPHAAGVAALLLAKNRDLTYGQVLAALTDRADRPTDSIQCDTCSSEECSSENNLQYPNNFYGYGRINAYNSYISI